MSLFSKSFKDRLAEKNKAKEKLAENFKRISAKPIKEKKKKISPEPKDNQVNVIASEFRPWTKVRASNIRDEYKARMSGEQLMLQPWSRELIDTVLESADLGTVTLCLIWPAKISNVPLLHGLANIERIFAKDLRGLRTLLYPGTHTYRSSLQSALIDRERLCHFYLSLWETRSTGTEITAETLSESFQAALSALNDIRLRHPDLPDPSLAELVPSFVFDSIKKVDNLANRRGLRQKIGEEWTIPEKAPGSLFVLHNTSKKDSWRVAFSHPAIKFSNTPEVILLDATQAASKTNYDAVKRIPDMLLFARENGLSKSGSVIVTDDPKVFFDLDFRLKKLQLTINKKTWAAESEDSLLSTHPVDANWRPENRSNSNFSISIVDRDASKISLIFQRMAIELKSDNSSAYQSLMHASLYILRLSNIPAGYRDITAASSGTGELDFVSQLNSWTPVKIALVNELSSGNFNAIRSDVEKNINRAEKLIDDWSDATPMALRLFAEIKKQKLSSKNRISIVLPNKKYVLIANNFLKRKMGDEWASTNEDIAWHTLSSVAKTLSSDSRDHLIFVGMSPDVLRILITHLHVPHGTVLLVAYRQAESTLKLINQMKNIEAFKAYRGRIGLMIQSLERRLNEIPNPINIGKLQDTSLTFQFNENGSTATNEHASYKLDLEGKGRIYISGWAYRYVPDDDPSFKRVAVGVLKPGDFIFDMSDDIRAELESSLQINDEGINSLVDPARTLLKLYHSEVQMRCSLMFNITKRSTLARVICEKMIQIDPSVEKCRVGRIYYWLQLQGGGDTRPHAPNDSNYFRIFCKALGMDEEHSEQYWKLIRNNRLLSQTLGRELVSRYAEILFQPESAKIYRKIPDEAIHKIQQEALRCVYRIENITPPIRLA